MDGDAGDLGETFLDEVFQGGKDVVDAGDAVIALHDAVAGDENVVIDLANADIMAIDEFVVIAVHVIEEGFDGQLELVHFAGADFWGGDVPAEWLDVDVDVEFNIAVAEGADGVLEFGGAAMGFTERKIFVDFEMEFDEEIAVLLEGGDVVDGMTHALSDGTDGFKEIFVVRGARFGMDDHVRWDDLADALLDGVGEFVDLF